MVKLILIPVLAGAAWGWQAASPSDAEAGLRTRVQQFYQLQQDEKYRQAEGMIADDTKDDYYNSRKPKIKGFAIEKVELEPNNNNAKVTVVMKILMLFPGAGAQIFDMHTPTYWKVENNEWRWYIPADMKKATPFGVIQTSENAPAAGGLDMKGAAPGGIGNPNLGALQGQISVDRKSVELSAEMPDTSVTISNGLPGPVDLRLDPHADAIRGLTVKIDKTHLDQGEKTIVHFHLAGKEKIADVVEIAAFPLNLPVDIAVRTK